MPLSFLQDKCKTLEEGKQAETGETPSMEEVERYVLIRVVH